MNPVRMLIAAVLLAGLTGVVWWSNKDEKAKAGKPAADAPPVILAIKPDQVKRIDIQRPAGESTSLQFNDKGKWEITSPKLLEADPMEITKLTTDLTNLVSDRLVDPNATDFAAYGLAPAKMEVDVTTKDGKVSKLLIGERTPTESAIYARLEGDPRLFTMSGSHQATFDKTSKDFREKHLLNFTGGRLKSVEVTAKGKNGPETAVFNRVGETDWEMVKPKKMRADGSKVDDIVSKLKLTEMDTNVPEADLTAAAAKFASVPLVGTVKVVDAVATQSIEIRKIDKFYYAKSSATEGVSRIGNDLGDILGKSIDDYRNTKIFDFSFSDPTKVSFEDGGKTASYEKVKAKWMANGKEMDATSVQALVDRLRDFSAKKFLDSGFTKAAITISVTSNEGKRTETVDLAPAAAGTDYIAQRRGEEGLYQIAADAVMGLRQAANDVKAAQAGAKK